VVFFLLLTFPLPPQICPSGRSNFRNFPGLRPGFILGENFRSNLGPRQRCIGVSTLGVFWFGSEVFFAGHNFVKCCITKLSPCLSLVEFAPSPGAGKTVSRLPAQIQEILRGANIVIQGI